MRKSFTLIETIVVVAVIGLTLPVIFAIIFTLMREQVKISRLSQVKREGDYIINLMENKIKNDGVMILSDTSPIPPDSTNKKCADASTIYTSNSSLYFLDTSGSWFGYVFNGSTITSSSSLPSSNNLTSSKTTISNFSISCKRNQIYSPPSVSISFTIKYNATSTRPEETASIDYRAGIKLRSH